MQSQVRPKYVARLERHLSEGAAWGLQPEELELRKQRRIVIYVRSDPRLAVTSIELLSPSNKQPGSIGQMRYLEKRASALHGGLNWVEIDLLRAGQRPPLAVQVPSQAEYLAYVGRATPTGWEHRVFAWQMPDPLPILPIPLLGADQAALDLAACFGQAYDRIAAEDEAGYDSDPPPPPISGERCAWIEQVLRQHDWRL